MQDVGFIIIGWLFGLLSPRIIDSIRLKYRRKEVAKAVKAEAVDLQCRLAVVSFLLAQKFGTITQDYLNWLKGVLDQYRGNEPINTSKEVVALLQALDDQQIEALIEPNRAKEGVGLTLKRYSACFIESHLSEFLSFPPDYQRYLHEFRNHFNNLNQEIDGALQYHHMTWDSSITGDNHRRLKVELHGRYTRLQEVFQRVCERLQPLIEYDERRL